MWPVLSIRVLPRRGVTLRAAVATLEIMTMLVVAHTWAGGELPTAAWLAVTAGLVFAAGTAVLRGRVPLRVMVPALTVAQLFLHSWMVVLASAPPTHGHGAPFELTWQMVLAHAAGALVTAAVWELRARAVDVVLAWSEPGLLVVPSLRRAVARHAPLLPLRRPLVVVPLRGPPVSLLAA
jgi:hypothetical protein